MSDPYEETATAPPSGPDTGGDRRASKPAFEIGATFDRYVIERELGSGGMGVVYAALDTDLQRRVALKVLREGLAEEAQQRLLREARAMARLQHSNVVTVFEVGTANARDFIAMELIEGRPLAEWLREEPRDQRAILDAFVAAGRGLAAAHAAGIVHRDFKPHNVLRGRNGRIAVTDFGLARDAADPLAVTVPGGSVTSGSLTDSDLTVPGLVLGTPAYMAPEQWTGGRLTPATDQFAFCIAVWEALTGERPYRGTTLEQLREQVTTGPAALDASKLPRHLRGVLRRGLAPDSSARWPSMDALLAKLAPRTTRVALVAIGSAALVATAAVVMIAMRSTGDGCRAPAIAPPAGVDLAAWNAQRVTACAAPRAVREAQLVCLDRVLARIDAIARVKQLAPEAHTEALAVDPAVCARAQPPELPARYSDAAVSALALRCEARLDPARVDTARSATASDPCAAAYVALADNRIDDAERSAKACGDDPALAVVALRRFGDEANALDDNELARRARETQAALDRAGKRDLAWWIDRYAGTAYSARRRYPDALASFEAAIAAAPKPDAAAVVAQVAQTLLERTRPADLAKARELIATWRPVAQADATLVETYNWMDATAQWMQGDVVTAGERLRALHARTPPMLLGSERAEGIVVDTKGAPVAGAIVAGGYALLGDPSHIATPLWTPTGILRMVDMTTTDARGEFVLEHGPGCLGVLVAQHGTTRARPVRTDDGRVRLVLEPTTRIAGRAELGGRVGTFLVGYSMINGVGSASVNVPVSADGTFEIAGVLPGEGMIGISDGVRTMSSLSAMQHVRVDTKRPPTNLRLELPAGRQVRVVMRPGVTFAGAPVFAVAGKFTGRSIPDLFAYMQEKQIATTDARGLEGKPADELVSVYRPGDMVSTFESAPTGPATVCTLRPIRSASCTTALPIACAQLSPNAAVVVIE